MFGPQIEKEFRVITLNNQERFKHLERNHRHSLVIAKEQSTVQPRHNRIGDLLRRLSFRTRTTPVESAS